MHQRSAFLAEAAGEQPTAHADSQASNPVPDVSLAPAYCREPSHRPGYAEPGQRDAMPAHARDTSVTLV